MVDKEKQLLIGCARDGFGLLNEYLSLDEIQRFFSKPLVPFPDAELEKYGRYLYSNHADAFYVLLSVLHACDSAVQVAKIIGQNYVRSDMVSAIDFIEQELYAESEFEGDVAKSVDRHIALADDELKANFSAKFNVMPFDILSLPTDCSVYFAKVNHGLWEVVCKAYDKAHMTRGTRFREIDPKYMERAGRTSGLIQWWGRQIHKYPLRMMPSASGGLTAFCVSLTAGAESPSESLERGLNPTTRGAAIGMLSMFETAQPGVMSHQLGDGSASRALIRDRRLEEFFEKYVADSEACLFIIPPHLKMIDFTGYKGAVYKLIVPPSKINEAWKVVIATAIGYLQRLCKKHRSITILAQGASVIPSLVLLIAEMESSFPGVRLRVFDFGRVLDVTTPEILQKQRWMGSLQDEYIKEGAKVFRNSTDIDFTLATLIQDADA